MVYSKGGILTNAYMCVCVFKGYTGGGRGWILGVGGQYVTRPVT